MKYPEPDPKRVEELRAELEKDIGSTHAVKGMAKHYAEEEARADAMERKVNKVLDIIDASGAKCLECDVAGDLVEEIRKALGEEGP
jgi:hypothetical protein